MFDRRFNKNIDLKIWLTKQRGVSHNNQIIHEITGKQIECLTFIFHMKRFHEMLKLFKYPFEPFLISSNLVK